MADVPTLSLPRRHRRELLFPPGLLALAGLLWLGAVALSAHPEQLRAQGVLQLTMPSLHPNREFSLYSTSKNSPFGMSSYQLNRFRPWTTISFSDSPMACAREQGRAVTAVRAMISNTEQPGGVRFRFSPLSHYEQLIFVLDLMNRENVRKYWFDTRWGENTLYAITTEGWRSTSPFGQAVDITNYPAPPPPVSFQLSVTQWVAELRQLAWLESWRQPFRQAQWQASWWLLAALAGLSGWRLVGQYRSR
jgi:hypothetical protein